MDLNANELIFRIITERTNRSLPIWTSSKFSHWPSASGAVRFEVTLWMRPPHAFWVLFKSSSVTRPAQNMSLSANHCVATSPNTIITASYIMVNNSYLILISTATILIDNLLIIPNTVSVGHRITSLHFLRGQERCHVANF